MSRSQGVTGTRQTFALIALRVAIGTADGLYARGFHPTSICGAFGAAAAAARLLDLDRTRTTHALGIVGSFAAGLFEYLSDGSQTKPPDPVT